MESIKKGKGIKRKEKGGGKEKERKWKKEGHRFYSKWSCGEELNEICSSLGERVLLSITWKDLIPLSVIRVPYSNGKRRTIRFRDSFSLSLSLKFSLTKNRSDRHCYTEGAVGFRYHRFRYSSTLLLSYYCLTFIFLLQVSVCITLMMLFEPYRKDALYWLQPCFKTYLTYLYLTAILLSSWMVYWLLS